MSFLETPRLNITELSLHDASFILALTNSPEWLRFIGDRGIKNLGDAENYIINGPRASYEKWGHGLYLVSLKETGERIGICGLIKRDALEDKDIGFALMAAYTGHGYAFEAAAAVLEDARKRLDIQRVVAIVLPGNTASIQLLEKLDFTFEKMIRMPGGTEDLMLFARQ